ncbi:MAG TPA: urease accessory UreF family protein [Dehalococcoidia bacterium]|nr:urease accessory UreF family protein [Dehalococcoidia bacterium]
MATPRPQVADPARDTTARGGLKASPTDVDATSALLALLQLADSAFPSGAFAHSSGLEQLARQRLVHTPQELERFVTSILHQSVATSDAPAACVASLAANADDLSAVLELDRALYRTKAAAELRGATLQTGRRLLEEVSAHCEDASLSAYASQVRANETLGTYPVAFGVVSAALGVDPKDVAPALMYSTAAAVLQASMRLLPVSHRDVQAILHRLRPQIASLAPALDAGDTPKLRSFNPMQEIASMRHAFAAARLFAS